jgi:hypothetical protein
MTNYTFKWILLSAIIPLSTSTQAQWCVPTTLAAYAPSMPGITNFTLNMINRNSSDLESMANNYKMTGLSTSLTAGATYTVSITHTIDASICPDMNLRVWIDYNHDFQLNDPGETVISTDHHLAGTYTGSFTVPLTAPAGQTRLRVTAKMSNLGGHTLPDPCDIPADPLGYHGEIEDYTVDISGATGMQDLNDEVTSFRVYPNPIQNNSAIHYALKNAGNVTIEIFNMLNEKIAMIITDEKQAAGGHEIRLNTPAALSDGIYIIQLSTDQAVVYNRIYVAQQK